MTGGEKSYLSYKSYLSLYRVQEINSICISFDYVFIIISLLQKWGYQYKKIDKKTKSLWQNQ